MTSIYTTGIQRTDILADGSLELDGIGVTIVLSRLTVHQCDALADAAGRLREQLLNDLDDVCGCDAQDLPLFDHDRLCPRRVLAEFRGVEA